ncbi:MAG: gliding motility-associated C-terminal domain-containing protein [Saprospiraceae bacterium]
MGINLNRIIWYICMLWAIGIPASSQNLLRNGDHEEFQQAPSVPNPSDLCFRELYPFGVTPPPLNPVNPPGIASANGSPDHRCDSPHTGMAHGGFFLSPKMENPIYALCESLTPGESYEISFFWRLTDGSDRAGKTIYLWLTDTSFQSNGPSVTPDQMDLYPVQKSDAAASLNDMMYQLARVSFQAQTSSNGLVIGNMTPADQPGGSEVVTLKPNGSGFAYYYIDDLAIRPIPRILPTEPVCPGTPVRLQLAHHIACGDTLRMDWYAVTEDGQEYLGTGDTLAWQGSETTTLLAISERDTLQTTVTIQSMPTEISDTLFDVPNLFTPNSDGTNDRFAPVIRSDQISEYLLQVHSRWGNEVFTSRDPAEGWDGTFKGNELPSDTYLWKLSFTTSACGLDVPIRQRGEISLVR